MSDVDWSRRLKWGLRFVLASVAASVVFFLVLFFPFNVIHTVLIILMERTYIWGYTLVFAVAVLASLLVAPRFAWGRYSLERLFALSAGLIFWFFATVLISRLLDEADFFLLIRSPGFASIGYDLVPFSLFMGGFLVTYWLVYRGGYAQAMMWLRS